MTEEETSELVARVRTWLLKQPRPSQVAVGERIVKIGTSPRWADVAKTVVNLGAGSVEALSAEGEVLRAETFGAAGEPEVQTEHGTEIAIPQVLSRDPETIRFTHVSTLLARAHENGNNFVVQLMDLFLSRMDRLEARLENKEAEAEAEFRARMEERLAAMPDDASKEDIMMSFFRAYTTAKTERQQAKPDGSNGSPSAPGWGN